MTRILIVDDDRIVRKTMQHLLAAHGYETAAANGCTEALRCIGEQMPDLVLLDVMMPVKNGFETYGELRKAGLQAPVIFLTAVPTDDMEIKGLGLGADDFIGKDMEDGPILARIARSLRRAGKIPETPAPETPAPETPPAPGTPSVPPAAGRGGARFSVGSANVYLQERRLVFADGRESPLSRADADILSALHSADGAFLTCSEIISRSRGDGYAMDAGTIRSEIFRLKTKLGKDGERIQGERGFGYRLA